MNCSVGEEGEKDEVDLGTETNRPSRNVRKLGTHLQVNHSSPTCRRVRVYHESEAGEIRRWDRSKDLEFASLMRQPQRREEKSGLEVKVQPHSSSKTCLEHVSVDNFSVKPSFRQEEH